MGKLLVKFSLTLVGFLIAFNSTGCMRRTSRVILPQGLPPGEFLATDKQILKSRDGNFDLSFFAQNDGTQLLVDKIQDLGGTVNKVYPKYGIVLATLTGQASLQIETWNKALGAKSTFSALRLSHLRKVSFAKESINPFTGARNKVQNFMLYPANVNKQMPLEEMKVISFREKFQLDFGISVDGSEAIVAILDTGLDLSRTDVFQDRVLVSEDLTGEGKLVLKRAKKTAPNKLEIDFKSRGAEGKIISSKKEIHVENNLNFISENIFVGFFDENQLNSEIDDVNQSGNNGDLIPVLVFESSQGYLVSLDADLDLNFSEEVLVADYTASKQAAVVDVKKIGKVKVAVNLPFNGTKLQVDKDEVVAHLSGFDSGRHGTHVSGITAGNFQQAPFNGEYFGVAPKAKILSYKVLGSRGGTDNAIIDGMVRAVEAGADVLNMSLGGLDHPADGMDPISLAVDRISRMSTALFVIAAGNEGPGMNQIGSPGTAQRAMTVGATISSETLLQAYNSQPNYQGIRMWYFSSRGAIDDGRIKPNIVAPGSAISSVPLAKSLSAPLTYTGVDLMQGTSMASPAAAGVAVLMIDAARKYNKKFNDNISTDNLSIQRALEQSAVSLNDLAENKLLNDRVSLVEEGAGLIQLPAAWNALKSRKRSKTPEYEIYVKNQRLEYIGNSKGIYATRPLADRFEVELKLQTEGMAEAEVTQFYKGLKFSASVDWLKPLETVTGVWSDNPVGLNIQVDRSKVSQLSPGVNAARIYAYDESNGQLEFYFDVTYVKPEELTVNNQFEILLPSLNLNPGQVYRQFFRVNEKTSKLAVSLKTLAFDDLGNLNRPGVLIFIYDPKGILKYSSENYLRGMKDLEQAEVMDPTLGVWELVMYKSPFAKSDLPMQLSIRASKVVSPQRLTLNLGESISFDLENYGANAKLQMSGGIDGIGFQFEEDLQGFPFPLSKWVVVPTNAREVTVILDKLSVNPRVAQTYAYLVNESIEPIAAGVNLADARSISAKVAPGMKIALLLYGQFKGEKNITSGVWSFDLGLENPITFSDQKLDLSWGESSKVSIQLDQFAEMPAVEAELSSQGFSPIYTGSLKFLETSDIKTSELSRTFLILKK